MKDKKYSILKFVFIFCYLLGTASATYMIGSGPCNDCLFVNTNVTSFLGRQEYYVGDAFYFNISLMNVDNKSLNFNLTVSITYTNNVIFTEDYNNLTLSPQQTINLYPGGTGGLSQSIGMPAEGVYTIQVSSKPPLTFYYCINAADLSTYGTCNAASKQNGYTYYFDVMPKWQKDWIDQSNKLLSTQINLSTQIVNLTEQTQKLQNDTQVLNTQEFELSQSIAVLTLLSVLLFLFSIVKENMTFGRSVSQIIWYILVLVILLYILYLILPEPLKTLSLYGLILLMLPLLVIPPFSLNPSSPISFIEVLITSFVWWVDLAFIVTWIRMRYRRMQRRRRRHV